MPGIHHRFCAMHMWRNFTKQCKDKDLRGVVWECPRALTDQEFIVAMAKVRRINANAWEYLAKFDPHSWSKSWFFEWPKVDNITNNNYEAFNAKILKFRGNSIITILEEIRCYIMKIMA